MKRALFYSRLSNTKGDDVSLERQSQIAHEYIAAHKEYRHDCKTDDFIEPKGMRSGTSDAARPAFRRLMGELENPIDVGLVFTYDLARFTRGDDLMMLLEKMRRQGVEFVTHRDIVDLESFDGQINVRAKSFLNRLYALVLSDSQRKRIQKEKQAGAWIGRAPLGLTIQGKGLERKLVASERTYQANGKTRKFLDTVTAWFRLYTAARGVGSPTAARLLNERGYRWWNQKWDPVLIKAHDLNRLNPRNYAGILDDDLVRRAITTRQERARRARNSPDLKHPPLLLRYLVVCEHCGKKYTSDIRVNDGLRFYRHYNGDCTHEASVRTNILEEQVLKILEPWSRYSDDVKERIAERIVTTQPATVDRRQGVLEKLDRLEEMRIDGTIARDKYNARHEECLKELEQLPTQAPKRQLTKAEYLEQMRNTIDSIQAIRQINPYLANKLMCGIFSRIIVDSGKLVRYELQPEFLKWFGV